jgi:coenzyme F420-0:L-glutamate ligase/coenzyme F420-1:gamma-L-glutamate ligase
VTDVPPGLAILPIAGLGDVRPGDDLAALIVRAAPWLLDGDVLVVTSKIVSKAEGALADVPAAEGPDRDEARASVLAAETARVVARRGPTSIVATRHGFVMAAAGIDASNVDPDHLVLLPKDPDASARALRSELRERFGLDVVVIVSDTMGRPWRNGLTDVALGVAGIEAIRDYRGERDAYGNELQITQMSPVDELAGAAELVKGKYDQVPVAVVRGLRITGTPDGAGAAILVRSADTDMFSLGTAEARADGLRLATRLDDPDVLAHAWPVASVAAIAGSPVSLSEDISRAIAAAVEACPEATFSPTSRNPSDPVGAGAGSTAVPPAAEPIDGETHGVHDGGIRSSDGGVAQIAVTVPTGSTAVIAARAGASIHILRASLASAGYLTTWLRPDADSAANPDPATSAIALGTITIRPRPNP